MRISKYRCNVTSLSLGGQCCPRLLTIDVPTCYHEWLRHERGFRIFLWKINLPIREMEKVEGEDCEIPSILGGEYGISPKKKRRDRFTSEMKDRQARGKDSMTGKEVKAEEEMDDNEKRDALGDGKGSA